MSDDDGGELDEAIAGARPEDPAAIALARAKIERALFGDLAPSFGRFRVLERLGHGGMGVVYSAYDPQLDRGVALKMIDVREGDHAAALAEAKSLAKLAHPNVVPVFDVGIEAGRVYIVMELVRGTTLREWCVDRPVAEVLDAYRQAAAGLAAAHDAGLIHRDVKPDNMLVGDDDRVRVVDFGLACEAKAATGRGAGTPRYMAPEQKTDTITPAVDQYSFCVSLAEALGDQPPRWVAAILERGRASKPDERYPSMHSLLRDLGRDPARVLRRRLVTGAIVVAFAALFMIARSRGDGVEACAGGDVEIAAAWQPAMRAMALGRASKLGAYGAELATKLAPELETHSTQWAAAHRAACLDHRRGVQSDEMFDRRMICLDRGRVALSELSRIATTATTESLPGVALAAASLPDPNACADREMLATSVAVPPAHAAGQIAALRDEIERSRVMISAGEFTRARDTLGGTIVRARAVAFAPTLAEALLVDGQAAMSTDVQTSALASLREATTLAFSVGAHAIAIEAWARRAYVEGNFVNVGTAGAGSEIIQAIADGAPTAHFARALLANNLGSLAWLAGRLDEMRAHHAAAEEEAKHVTGAGRIELLVVQSNSLMAAEDPSQRDDNQVEVIRKLTDAVGAGHPLTLWNRYLRATVTMPDPRAALTELEPTCTAMDAHPSMPQRSANCWAEVAEVRDVLGDVPGAITAAARAMRDVVPDVYPELAGYLAWWRGDSAGALRLLTDAVDAIEPDPSNWYTGFDRAKIDLARGRVLHAMGRADEARSILSSTSATLSSVPIRKTTIVRRYVAQIAALTATSERPPGAP